MKRGRRMLLLRRSSSNSMASQQNTSRNKRPSSLTTRNLLVLFQGESHRISAIIIRCMIMIYWRLNITTTTKQINCISKKPELILTGTEPQLRTSFFQQKKIWQRGRLSTRPRIWRDSGHPISSKIKSIYTAVRVLPAQAYQHQRRSSQKNLKADNSKAADREKEQPQEGNSSQPAKVTVQSISATTQIKITWHQTRSATVATSSPIWSKCQDRRLKDDTIGVGRYWISK